MGVVRDVVRFHGTSGGLLREVLGVHARLGGASGAAILTLVEPGRVDAVCEWGVSGGAGEKPQWMAIGAELVGEISGAERPAVVHPWDGGWVVVVPLGVLEEPRSAAAFALGPVGADEARRSAARLELGVIALWAHRVVSRHQAQGPGVEHLRQGVEIAATVMGKSDLRTVGATLVNELASALGAERVALGIARGGARRWMRLDAASGIDRVQRSMSIVPGLEAAMEECAEQDQEIVVPEGAGATVISRAHRDFASRHGAVAIASLPVRTSDADDPIVGVVTILRPADRPIGIEELSFARLVLELVSGRVAECRNRAGWFGARIARAVRRGAGRFVGPDHALAKVAGILFAIGLIASVVVRGPERIGAPATVLAAEARVCAAPVRTTLVSVDVNPGDAVRAGETVLGRLDETTILLELAEARARAGALEQSEASARGKGETAEAQIARAQRDEVEARIALLEHNLGRMVILAPIDGVVARAPERSRIGSVVEMGEPLFEVDAVGGLRVEARAPVRWIAEIGPEMHGELSLAGRPGPPVDVVVEHAEPVVRRAKSGAPGDAFLVWGRIEGAPEWARVGMVGVVRFEVGRAPMLTIWTRRAADTIRAWGWW